MQNVRRAKKQRERRFRTAHGLADQAARQHGSKNVPCGVPLAQGAQTRGFPGQICLRWNLNSWVLSRGTAVAVHTGLG